MHVADIEFEAGDWMVVKRSLSEIILHKTEDHSADFPRWEGAIPRNYEKFNKTSYCYNPYAQSSVIRLIKQLPSKVGINIKYMEDLKNYTWDVYYSYDPQTGIVFKSEQESLMAVIMPIQIDMEK